MYKTSKIINKKENYISIIHAWKIQKPLGVIQLIHGSLEHCKRYDAIAKVFNQAGFNVIGNDHRGHGLTAKINQTQLGHVGKNQNAQKIINDLLNVNQLIKKEHPKIPVILFGHSWGSYLARACMSQPQFNYQGAIISGTGWENKCKVNLALFCFENSSTI